MTASRVFSRTQRSYIFARDDHACAYCGDSATVIDHVVPYSRGGPTIVQNAVACCSSCNARKLNNMFGPELEAGLLHLAQRGESLDWTELFSFNHDDDAILRRYHNSVGPHRKR